MQINFNRSTQGGETEINTGKVQWNILLESCLRTNIAPFCTYLEQGFLV